MCPNYYSFLASSSLSELPNPVFLAIQITVPINAPKKLLLQTNGEQMGTDLFSLPLQGMFDVLRLSQPYHTMLKDMPALYNAEFHGVKKIQCVFANKDLVINASPLIP